MENLKKYFQLYEEKNYKENFYFLSYNELFIDLITLFLGKDYYIFYNENKIFEILDKLKKEILSVNNKEEKKKLLPLILILGNSFYSELIENNFFDEIVEDIFYQFETLNVKVSSKDFLSQETIKSIENLNQYNFNEIYQYFFYFNTTLIIFNVQYAQFMYKFSLKYGFNQYCEILDKKDIFTFLNLIKSLNKIDKEALFKIRTKLSKNFDALNLTLLAKYPNNSEIIEQIILDFSQTEEKWKKFIKFLFQTVNNSNIYISLGKIISDLDKERIKIISKFISFEKNIDDFFFNIQNDKYKKLISFKIYKNWKQYLKKNKSINNINENLTSLKNIILYYAENYLDIEKRKKLINKILNFLKKIDNIWFDNYLEYLKCLYYLLTFLYIYSYKTPLQLFQSNNLLINLFIQDSKLSALFFKDL
jgi:hypothetical protein